MGTFSGAARRSGFSGLGFLPSSILLLLPAMAKSTFYIPIASKIKPHIYYIESSSRYSTQKKQ